MILIALDFLGDVISNLVWFVNGIQTGNPLYNFGITF